MDAEAKFNLAYYQGFSYLRDAAEDIRVGREDGIRNFPPVSQKQLSSYELAIAFQAKAAVDQYRNCIDTDLDTVIGERAQLQKERMELYGGRTSDLSAMKAAESEEARNTLGPQSPAHRAAARDHDEADDLYRSLARREAREVQLHFAGPKTWFIPLSPYIILMLLLAAAEIPVNLHPFSRLLDSEGSYILAGPVALLVGLVLVFLAHSVGLTLRTLGHTPGRLRRWLKVLIGLPLTLGLGVGLIYWTALLRQAGTGGVDIQGLLTGNVAASGAGVLGLDATGWPFLLINLAVFLCGILLSYFRHDSNPQLERAYFQRAEATRRQEALSKAYHARLHQIETDYTHRFTDERYKADRLTAEIERLRLEEDAIKNRGFNNISLIFSVTLQRIQAYQKGNQDTRSGDPPAYFGNPTVPQVEAIVGKVLRLNPLPGDGGPPTIDISPS